MTSDNEIKTGTVNDLNQESIPHAKPKRTTFSIGKIEQEVMKTLGYNNMLEFRFYMMMLMKETLKDQESLERHRLESESLRRGFKQQNVKLKY